MCSREYRHQAWDSLSGKWGTIILASVISSLLTTAASFIFFGSLLITGLVGVGMASIMLSLIRRQDVSISQIFDGFQTNLSTNFVAGILYNIYIIFWSLLFIIPGIVKAYSYAMTFYILRDNQNLTASEAITESRRIMYGNKMRLFCLDFSFIGWYLLSICTFGILLLWVVPYHQAARAAFYESIRD